MDEKAGLFPGWKDATDRKGRHYWYNTESRVPTWKQPTGPTDEWLAREAKRKAEVALVRDQKQRRSDRVSDDSPGTSPPYQSPHPPPSGSEQEGDDGAKGAEQKQESKTKKYLPREDKPPTAVCPNLFFASRWLAISLTHPDLQPYRPCPVSTQAYPTKLPRLGLWLIVPFAIAIEISIFAS
jgi:hypothetical protein